MAFAPTLNSEVELAVKSEGAQFIFRTTSYGEKLHSYGATVKSGGAQAPSAQSASKLFRGAPIEQPCM